MINNDETKDKIELDEYNSFIMNVGVYDGKRYIVPLSYGMNGCACFNAREVKTI